MNHSSSKRFHNLPEFKYFRKKLRKNATPAEAKLWTYLKNKQLDGRRFRRQHGAGPYVLDFYCPSEKLAIELDGDVHSSAMAAEYDAERKAFLRQYGIEVLRFENRTVFEYPDWLLEQVRRVWE